MRSDTTDRVAFDRTNLDALRRARGSSASATIGSASMRTGNEVTREHAGGVRRAKG